MSSEIIILILWLTLILAGISINSDRQLPFGLNQTAALRGICAVEIMIGHIGIATGSIILFPNRKAGILFVGIFFILSGYGVAYSAEHKEGYMKYFLINRAVKLLLSAYTVKIIMLAIEKFLVGDIGGGIGTDNFLTGLNWYVWEQLLFYLVYWLAYKLLPSRVELCVGFFSGLFIILAYAGGMENPWYGSSLCFALGLYYYRYEKEKPSEKNSGGMGCFEGLKYYILLAMLLLVTGISIVLFFVLGNESVIGNPFARNIASVSFGIAVIMLLYRVKIGNKTSCLLGRCSYEIFLVHPYMIFVMSKMAVKPNLLFGILVIVLSVLLACLIHLLMEKVLCWLQRGCKNML